MLSVDLMKNIVILGSTGSIGKQALDVVRTYPEQFKILALCAYGDADTLIEQAREFLPHCVGLTNPARAQEVRLALPGVNVICGADVTSELAALPQADTVVHGVRGFYGTKPLLTALAAGKTVALANKESIVCAHELVREAIAQGGGMLLPVDSEQSAIFQCMCSGKKEEIKRLILTASGGPFRSYTAERLRAVTLEDALKHPTWRMGKKLTLDSATLFNKGLEIMEASYLFDIPAERIEVVVHPESVVHSMVEYVDGSSIAQLSRPDMRLAIQYALTYPKRINGNFGAMELTKQGSLTFFEPNTELFHAIPLAYEALRCGGIMPIVYNAANEVAAGLFFEGSIGFLDIQALVEYTMGKSGRGSIGCFEDVLQADAQARRLAAGFIPHGG